MEDNRAAQEAEVTEGGQQSVYLNTWDNEGVVSMLLGMELFLLVKHTHSPFRMKRNNVPTKARCPQVERRRCNNIKITNTHHDGELVR